MLQVNKTRFYFENKEDRSIFYTILKKYNCTLEVVANDTGYNINYLYNVINGQKSVSDKLRLYLFEKFDYDIDLLRLFKII